MQQQQPQYQGPERRLAQREYDGEDRRLPRRSDQQRKEEQQKERIRRLES